MSSDSSDNMDSNDVDIVTLKEAQDYIDELPVPDNTKNCDHEALHSNEDGIYEDFLRAISANLYSSKEEIVAIARVLLQSKDCKFARWCG
jgi:hypothetical protein